MNIQLLPMRPINTGGPASYAGISNPTKCAQVERHPHGLRVGAISFAVQFDLGDLLLGDANLHLAVPFGQHGEPL